MYSEMFFSFAKSESHGISAKTDRCELGLLRYEICTYAIGPSLFVTPRVLITVMMESVEVE